MIHHSELPMVRGRYGTTGRRTTESSRKNGICCEASTEVQAAAASPSRTGRRRSVTAAKKENCRMCKEAGVKWLRMQLIWVVPRKLSFVP